MRNQTLTQKIQGQKSEVFNPYNLFDVTNGSIRLQDEEANLEKICKGHYFSLDILKIEDNDKSINIKFISDMTENYDFPHLNEIMRGKDNRLIKIKDLLKLYKLDISDIIIKDNGHINVGGDAPFKHPDRKIDEGGYELSFGTYSQVYSLNELIKYLNAIAKPSDDNTRMMIDIPIYRLEADFIVLSGYRKLVFDSSVKEDKREEILNSFELVMCSEFHRYLHRQNVDCELHTFIQPDMVSLLDPIPTIEVWDGGYRTLTPAFVRPLYGFKFVTPYFYKDTLFALDDNLKLISKIGSAFSEYVHDLKKGTINDEDKVVELDINNIRLSDECATVKEATYYLFTNLFYDLIKDGIKPI